MRCQRDAKGDKMLSNKQLQELAREANSHYGSTLVSAHLPLALGRNLYTLCV
jgi:hypothetical protein